MTRVLKSVWTCALDYDFCPWANRYVYWLKRPAGWVALAWVSALLLGMFVSSQALLAVGMIAAVGGIGFLWPWISMMGIRAQMGWGDQRCQEEETVETTLTIVNRWPWPVWGLVLHTELEIAHRAEFPDQPISLRRIPACSRTRFRWACCPSRRGIYPLRATTLASAFPFGIWSSHRIVGIERPLVVWPRTFQLSDVPENTASRRMGVGGISPRLGHEGDWMGVRPYRDGDSLRQVHWAQTARRDSLVVFERQAQCQQTVAVALDPAAAIACLPEECDWMIRMLASVAGHFMNHAWNVRVSLDDRWRSIPLGQRSEWMDHLAAWQPEESSDHVGPVVFERGEVLRILITTSSRSTATHVNGQGCIVLTSGWTNSEDRTAIEDAIRRRWRGVCQCTAREVDCA